ncbi:hypothetical protein L3Q82_025032, partial [Scortum barcoo]
HKPSVRRELPKHQRDLIVQRYQSGEGYKRISKELNIPWKILDNSDITINRTSVWVEGIMNSSKYQSVLAQNLPTSVSKTEDEEELHLSAPQ